MSDLSPPEFLGVSLVLSSLGYILIKAGITAYEMFGLTGVAVLAFFVGITIILIDQDGYGEVEHHR